MQYRINNELRLSMGSLLFQQINDSLMWWVIFIKLNAKSFPVLFTCHVRPYLGEKMDDFLDSNVAAPGANAKSDAEQALKIIAQSNPDLLIQIVRSIQSANTD